MTFSYCVDYLPAQRLLFRFVDSQPREKVAEAIYNQFEQDWRRGWFYLAAQKVCVDEPTLLFWQQIAFHYLTAVCHINENVFVEKIPCPDFQTLEEWELTAPPMLGGEYITPESLAHLWDQLNEWCLKQTAQFPNLASFLEKFAPLWQDVGRVCFHLAENKKDHNKPFAFLATYATGISAGGKLKHLPLKEALVQYSGHNNRPALIKLLTPIQRSSEKCQWVQNLLDTCEIYHPLSWTAQQAYQLLSTIPDLEQCGLAVRIPNWWKQRSRPQVSVTIGGDKQSGIGLDALLDFDIRLCIGDEELSEDELKQILDSKDNLALIRGQWVEVDKEKLQEALKQWKLIQKNNQFGQISFLEGMRLLAGAPTDLDEDLAEPVSEGWVHVQAGKRLQEILQKLTSPNESPFEAIPGLNANLRHYQTEGVSWLHFLTRLGLGACLADDMGLGKTIQILAYLQKRRLELESHPDNHAPALLIVPASLLGNWQKEAVRFTPSLKTFLLHPSEVKPVDFAKIIEDLANQILHYDLVITTYSMVSRLTLLGAINWDTIILDEAQAIKNPGTKQTKAVKALPAKTKIALTGTPIENRLFDLWSLFDFINPGLLGTARHFKKYVQEASQHPKRYEVLRKLTSPYILRRMKTDPKIISDLPSKIEASADCHLTHEQASYYQAVVEALKTSLDSVAPGNRRGLVLKAILELKQICNHPDQYSGLSNFVAEHSGKFGRLREICEELASRQEKVLIFTQFSSLIPYLKEFLRTIFGRNGLSLDGNTPIKQRKELVEAFQKTEGPPFFVLSIKAGGTGLTLTEASHVIHFDRWWNPAVENQATDRAFRIGQKKSVLVHKFVTLGTIEEKIDAIIASKQMLATEILAPEEEMRLTELSNDELINLVTLDINKATLS